MIGAGLDMRGKLLAMLLAATLLFAAVMPVTAAAAGASDINSDNQFPGVGNDTLYATTKIKTQKAADSIKNGIRGIDVSKHNGAINWSKVAQDDVKFAMIRATCGYTQGGKYQFATDPNFVENATQANKNGLYVGAYHHACFTSQATMQKEAAEFIKMLGKVKITYPVVLDIELNPKKLSKTKLSALAREFCDIVSKAGYTVLIYSYQNFFKDHLDVKQLGNYKLWVANYIEQPTGIDHVMWQHTSMGKVSGISGNVDINIAYKSLATKKTVTVDKNISDTIKKRLSEVYKANVPTDGLSGIQNCIYKALQMEINKQWGVKLAVNDKPLSRDQLDLLSEVEFTGETKGNITYLIQARLFYLGYYKGELTSRFDTNTKDALKQYQASKSGLKATGEMSEATLQALFG